MRLLADRRFRYALAGGLIVIGFLCGAVSTGPIGGALATVLIATGMITLAAVLLRDVGLSTRPVPPARPPSRPAGRPPDAARAGITPDAQAGGDTTPNPGSP